MPSGPFRFQVHPGLSAYRLTGDLSIISRRIMLRCYRNLSMTLRLVMAASAALAFSVPAVSAPVMAVAAVQTASITEAEMEARTQAFEARMEAMKKELQDAVDGADGDTARIKTDTDAIITRYTPEIMGFIDDFAAFLNGQIANEPDAEERQQMENIRDQVLPMLRMIPDQLRAGIQQGIDSAEADESKARR